MLWCSQRTPLDPRPYRIESTTVTYSLSAGICNSHKIEAGKVTKALRCILTRPKKWLLWFALWRPLHPKGDVPAKSNATLKSRGVIGDGRAEATRRVLNRPVKAVRQGRHSLPLNNPSDCYPIYRGGITPIAVVFDVPGYGYAELALVHRSELRRPLVMAKVFYLSTETPSISDSTEIGAHSKALLQASWYK